LFPIGDVGLEELGDTAIGLNQLLDPRGARLVLQVVDGHLRAVACKEPGRRTPDTAASTGDEDDLPF